MTWIAKMMTIAWVSAEERRSWGFTAGALMVFLMMLAAVVVDGDLTWHLRGVYQALGCTFLLPVAVVLLRQVIDELYEDSAEMPLVLPLWLMLLAAAVGGLALDDSWLGFVAMGFCIGGCLAFRHADRRLVHRRAVIAEEIARGRLLTDPWETEWYGRLADALIAQGKRHEALKALQRWRVRDPWSAEPQQRMLALRSPSGMAWGRPVATAVMLAILGAGIIGLLAGASDGFIKMVFGGSFCRLS